MKIRKNDLVLLIGDRDYLVQAGAGKFGTRRGEIDLNELSKGKYGDTVKTHLGQSYTAVEPRTGDILKKIKRAPQIIGQKDAGYITGRVCLGKDDIVLEAGTGSAAMTIFMAGIAKKIISYELRKDFYKIAKGNIERFGIKNVTIRNKSAEKGFTERNADIAMLDMGSPELVIPHIPKSLKPGGYLVVYSPVIEQVQRVHDAIKKSNSFTQADTEEVIMRRWDIGGNKTRPKTQMLGHTAFLTFARRI